MDTHPAEQVGRIGAAGRKEPTAGVAAAQRCRREQAADQGVAIAHRPQQQSRRRRRLVRVAPDSVRANGIDEKRNTRGESDDASGERGTVDRHSLQPRTRRQQTVKSSS
jgi:hypothetical protein